MENNNANPNDHIKNYTGPEAVKKLKDLAQSARICMFLTFKAVKPLPCRPMALQQVDEEGTLYFFSEKTSNTNTEIATDPSVQLFFENRGSSEYLSVYGNATISQDREKIKQLWSPWAKTWFQGGPDDETLTLISVKPHDAQYWDTKHNKMVQLLKIAASMVSGKTMDDGVEGKLYI
ncbi:MAG: pyridoxamine 5'-phosphate oxidase family protein [Bacteroidetes bacterium]|nr:pyridoxamine 5'-phosphate oxidase family protein [Bacteroidota bacterium]